MWFTKLELGDFIIAPRPRYAVEKMEYKPNLRANTNSSCITCGSGAIESWDIVYTINCIGNGDFKAANRVFKDLENFANSICADNKQKLVRQLCDEDPLEHYITVAYFQPIEQDRAIDCCYSTALTGELHMISPIEDDQIEVVIYNYKVYTP